MALIWAGQILSQAGTRMYQIALVWWIVSRSAAGTGRDLGLFMVAGALPAILFVKPIGQLIDSTRSKRLLVACDLLGCAVVSGVGLVLASSRLGLPAVLVSSFLIALSAAVFDPTLNRALAEAVSSEDMEEAIAFQSSTQSLASFGGAAAGALLIDRLGLAGVVWLNAASFLVSAACNGLLELQVVADGASAPAAEDQDLSAWQLLSRLPLIKNVLLGFGLTNFFLTPILIVLPLYVQKTLRASAASLGGLEAGVWLGLLCGAFVAKWVRFGDTLVLGSVCVAAAGLSLGLPGLIVDERLMLAALFAAGAALGVNNVKFLALFQEKVPAEFKGRFFALMQALLSFSYPAAYLVFGLLADVFEPPRVCLIQGLGILGLSAYFFRLSRRAQAQPCSATRSAATDPETTAAAV